MTADQEGLLQKARDSVRGAKLLAEDGLHDFAVSRAYYAMFYIATAFLLGRGLKFSKHSAVHAAFGRYFVKTGLVPAEFHQELLAAARLRNVGDYTIGPDLTPEDSAQSISQAEEFIRFAEERLDTIADDAG